MDKHTIFEHIFYYTIIPVISWYILSFIYHFMRSDLALKIEDLEQKLLDMAKEEIKEIKPSENTETSELFSETYHNHPNHPNNRQKNMSNGEE